MPDPRVERRLLLLSTGTCLGLGILGLVVAGIAGSQAVLLDGVFYLVFFATGLSTLRVSRLVQRPDDERYPYGYGAYEPLMNALKAMLIVGISVMALIGAVVALLSGGRVIEPGPAVLYAAVATAASCVLAIVTNRRKEEAGSPLVAADAQNWRVNGAVSLAVLLAFGAIILLERSDLAVWAPHVDPLVVIVLVLIFIAVPIRIGLTSLGQLLGRSPSGSMVREIEELVRTQTESVPWVDLYVRLNQTGRFRLVTVHVVLPSDYRPGTLEGFDRLRETTQAALREWHPGAFLEMVFTASPTWGRPVGLSGPSTNQAPGSRKSRN